MIRCTHCNYPNVPESAAFCPRCGAALKADMIRAVESERLRLLGGELRLLTVFFVNLSGIDRLIRKETYATMKDHVQDFLTNIETIIDEYNGTSNRIIPDFRILGIFGAPHAHHDDTLRATRCVSRIRDWWVKIKGESKILREIDLKIGLNTGRAFFGFVLKESPFLTVIGDTINIAARLTEISHQSEILMSRTTYNAVFRYIDAEHVGEQTVKGKTTKVDIYRLKKIRTTPRTVEPLRMPLFGRENELTRLLILAQESVTKGAVYCIINGQLGIGKTRLKEELEVSLNKNDEVTCLETNCSVNIQSPYYPFRTLLRDMLSLHEHDSKDIMGNRIEAISKERNLNPALARGIKHLLLTDIGRLHSEEMRKANEEIYASMRNIIRTECHKKPMILIFEEFGQADIMSKDLVTYLMSELVEDPVMLLLINAPEYRFEGIPSSIHEIDLKALTRPSVHALVRHILGNVDSALADFIYREAGGNPLFTIEAIRNTRRNQIIKLESGKWYLAKDQALVFLDDLYGLVTSTIDSLDPDARLIVDYAAVIGYRFSLRILKELLTRSDLKDHLENLVAEGYIVLSSDGEDPIYLFRHNLLKDAAYTVLPVRKRKEIHLRVANLFEQIYSQNLSSFYEDVARHYLASDQYEYATKYYKLAGDKAKNLYAIDQAVSFYEQVMAINKEFSYEIPQDMHRDIMLNLIDIYEIKGDITKMEKTARERLLKAKKDGDQKNAVLFAERDAYGLILLNHTEQAEALLIESIEKCDDEMAYILSILYADLGMLYAGNYEYDKCLLNYNLSWRTARANNIKEAEILCLLNLSKLHKGLGNYEKALDYLHHGLEILVDAEDIRKNIELQYLIAGIDYEIWNVQKAKDSLNECLMTADSIGSFDAYIRSALDLACIYSLNGDSGHVMGYLKDVDKKISFLIRESLLAEINLKKAFVYCNRHDFKKANDYVINSIRIAEKSNQREIEFHCYRLLSIIDTNHNMENARRALDLAERMKMPPLIGDALYRITEIFFENKDIERARYYGRKALLVYDDIKSRLSDSNRKHYIRRPEYSKLLEI
jgi:class 3 adenylate cyclase